MVSLSHTQFKTLHNYFRMHNLFIMNQSVNCEVFVSFSYILEMHLLVFKVFKI